VDRESRQIVGQTRRGRGEVPRELTHEPPQAGLGHVGAGRRVERRPVGGPDAGMEARPLGQLGEHVPKSMDGAAAAVGIGPQLVDRPDEAGCPVGDDAERAAQATSQETPPEVEPVLGPLPRAEADVEQDPIAVGSEAPGDEDAFLGTLGPDGQVVGSDRGAVAASRPLRLPGPPSEPDVRVATHPALHGLTPLRTPSILPFAQPLVEPARVSRGEVGVDIPMAGQPAIVLGLVGVEVVEDNVDLQVGIGVGRCVPTPSAAE
jgi:hypothetical protein